MSSHINYGLFKFDLTDYHAVLGVSLDADAKQIRQRYLKVVYRLHPDTCKAKDETEKKQASEMLSKLVNPAYEQLSRKQSQAEHHVVLSQVGQRLAQESRKITLASEAAKQLYQAENTLENTYDKLLKALAAEQYKDLGQVTIKTAQISELNLVYLMLKHKLGKLERSPQKKVNAAPAAAKPPAQNNSKPPEKKSESPLAVYLRRAQESLDRNQFAQAIMELRDAIAIDPNNSTCHGLMGLAYLKQNQLSMAKVHINKALQSNAQDPTVTKAKQELDRLSPPTNPTGSKSTESRGGIFGGLFGGKKK